MIELLPRQIVMPPTPRSFAAWLAIFSLVLNGMLPLAGHAASMAAAMTICSSTIQGQSDAPLKSNPHTVHCAYCATSLDSPIALPGKVVCPTFDNPASGMPSLPVPQPAPDACFSCAQPRAPPIHSA